MAEVSAILAPNTMRGRHCLVVGASVGIGKETARQLAKLGATVILTAPDAEIGEAVREELAADTGSQELFVEVVDLSLRASIKDFVSRFKLTYSTLHLLVNCADDITDERVMTSEKVERIWATNVLGVYQITARVLPMLRYCRPARVVNVVSSRAGGLDLTDTQFARRPWNALKAYDASKQAQRMLSWAWAAGLDGSTVTVNAIDPGHVLSDRYDHVPGAQGTWLRAQNRWMGKSAVQAAESVVWLATQPELIGVTDQLWGPNRRPITCHFRDREKLLALMSLCEGTSRLRIQYDSNAFFQEEYDSMVMNRTFTGF